MHDQAERTVWRRFEGASAEEIHIQCRPDARPGRDIGEQTADLYQNIEDRLKAAGSSLSRIVYQTVFFRNIRRDFREFHAAYLQIFAGQPLQPASMFIEQPPLDTATGITVSAIALTPRDGILQDRCCPEPANSRIVDFGDQRILYSGTLYGEPGSAFDQAGSMFRKADQVLAGSGMEFRDVVRTWIYLRNIERDYGEFNRARREFFRQRGVTLLPASTGIHGSPLREDADLVLGFCALQSGKTSLPALPMTTPTLNEAPTYGSDFSRGLRVTEAHKVALYISGTASVDEEGRTAHAGDFDAQAERMLWNVETLLAAQNASFADVLSAVTYLKCAADAPALRRILHSRGLAQLPNAIVHAAVCRTDLLCEMEAIAALRL